MLQIEPENNQQQPEPPYNQTNKQPLYFVIAAVGIIITLLTIHFSQDEKTPKQYIATAEQQFAQGNLAQTIRNYEYASMQLSKQPDPKLEAHIQVKIAATQYLVSKWKEARALVSDVLSQTHLAAIEPQDHIEALLLKVTIDYRQLKPLAPLLKELDDGFRQYPSQPKSVDLIALKGRILQDLGRIKDAQQVTHISGTIKGAEQQRSQLESQQGLLFDFIEQQLQQAKIDQQTLASWADDYREQNQKLRLAKTLLTLGATDTSNQQTYLQEAQKIAKHLAFIDGLALVEVIQGLTLLKQQKFSKARHYLKQAQGYYKKLGASREQLLVHKYLVMAESQLLDQVDNSQKHIDMLQSQLSTARQQFDNAGMVFHNLEAGWLAAMLDSQGARFNEAEQKLQSGLSAYAKFGADEGLLRSLLGLSINQMRQGNWQAAQSILNRLSPPVRAKYPVILIVEAHLLAQTGATEQAVELLQQAKTKAASHWRSNEQGLLEMLQLADEITEPMDMQAAMQQFSLPLALLHYPL